MFSMNRKTYEKVVKDAHQDSGRTTQPNMMLLHDRLALVHETQ